MIELVRRLNPWVNFRSLVLTLLMPVTTWAGDQDRIRVVQAVKVDTAPVIDGDLSDAVWQQARIATDFFRAKEGNIRPARLNTEVRILYDENALYIGVYCEEPDMNRLRETKMRRDSHVWRNDCIEVLLDTYRDRRNCYVFATNTLGTQMDERISNESVFDMSWDAGWESRVSKHRHGWTAEFAIPFRVLRFDPRNTTWGINFWRTHPINGQSYSWARTAFFGRVSEFGYLSWRSHRNTLIFRLRSNYQFSRKVGWRVFVERVDERLRDETLHSFNAIFDYEFTPESHFFFVFVDSRPGKRAVFTKLAYLFEAGFPAFGRTN